MRTLHFTLITAIALATSACSNIHLADSVDLTFDWAPLAHPDHLHMPYVAGSSFHLYTLGVDPDDLAGWTLESNDGSVIRVDSTSDGEADVTAVGPGTASMTLFDADGHNVHDIGLDVRQADRAELAAHGALIIDRPDLQDDWSEIHVLAGGSATFEVTWFAGDEQLFGNGALSAVAEGDIVVTPRQTFLFEDREWVTFSPGSPGTYDVQLLANGRLVRTVRVIAVTEDAVDHVELHGMDESQAHEGDLLTVLAQAYDAEGNTVFGVEYAWDLDGEDQDGYGDLYRYELAPESPRRLCARFGALEADAMIHANEGFVDSTNHLGCSVAGVGMPGGAAFPAVLFALVALRRRALARRRGA